MPDQLPPPPQGFSETPPPPPPSGYTDTPPPKPSSAPNGPQSIHQDYLNKWLPNLDSAPAKTYQAMINADPAKWNDLLRGYSSIGRNALLFAAQKYKAKPTVMRAANAGDQGRPVPEKVPLIYDPADPLGYAGAVAEREQSSDNPLTQAKGFLRGVGANTVDPRMIALAVGTFGVGPAIEAAGGAVPLLGKAAAPAAARMLTGSKLAQAGTGAAFTGLGAKATYDLAKEGKYGAAIPAGIMTALGGAGTVAAMKMLKSKGAAPTTPVQEPMSAPSPQIPLEDYSTPPSMRPRPGQKLLSPGGQPEGVFTADSQGNVMRPNARERVGPVTVTPNAPQPEPYKPPQWAPAEPKLPDKLAQWPEQTKPTAPSPAEPVGVNEPSETKQVPQVAKLSLDDVLNQVKDQPTHPDQITNATGGRPQDVSANLMMLEAAGKVKSVPGGRYVKVATEVPQTPADVANPQHMAGQFTRPFEEGIDKLNPDIENILQEKQARSEQRSFAEEIIRIHQRLNDAAWALTGKPENTSTGKMTKAEARNIFKKYADGSPASTEEAWNLRGHALEGLYQTLGEEQQAILDRMKAAIDAKNQPPPPDTTPPPQGAVPPTEPPPAPQGDAQIMGLTPEQAAQSQKEGVGPLGMRRIEKNSRAQTAPTPQMPPSAAPEPAPTSTPATVGEAQAPPSVATSTKGLVRNFRAGNNNGSVQFSSELQRDLYDIAAKRSQQMRGAGNRGVHMRDPMAGIEPIMDRVKSQVPEGDISRLAMDTYNDVKSQMKGVQDGETRVMQDNVGQSKLDQALSSNAEAIKNIGKGRAGSGLEAGAELTARLAYHGALLLAKGTVNFAKWSAAMVKEFGEGIKPHLMSAWDMAHDQMKAGGPREPSDPLAERIKAKVVKGQTDRLVNNEANVRDILTAEKEKKPLTFHDTVTGVTRNFKLSGGAILPKLLGVSITNVPVEALADSFGFGAGKIRYGGKSLAEISGREGNYPLESVGTGFSQAYKPGAARAGTKLSGPQPKEANIPALQNLKDVMKHGQSEIATRAGKTTKGGEFGGIVGRVHGAEKTLGIETPEYYRSLEIRLKRLAAAGENTRDPVVQAKAKNGAAIDAQNAILRGDNKGSKALNNLFESVQKSESAGVRVAGTLVETQVPVRNVAANFLGKLFQGTGWGMLEGTGRLTHAALTKAEMTPEMASKIITAYKYGGLGLVMATLAYYQPKEIQFAGMYSKDGDYGSDVAGKRGPMDVSIMGKRIPKLWVHNPMIYAGQLWATVFREARKHGAGGAAGSAVKGLAEQVPGMESVTDLGKGALEPGTYGEKLGRVLGRATAGNIIPQAVQGVARMTDTEKTRKPQGFWDEIDMAAPYLRAKVPTSTPKKPKSFLSTVNSIK